MKIKPSSYFLIFILLLMVFVIVVSSGFPVFQAKFLFLLFGSLVLVIGAVQLVKELRARDKTEVATAEEEPTEAARGRDELRGLISPLSWVAGFFMGILLFGFYVAIPLFVFLFMKLRRRSWIMSISSAVILVVVVYLIFDISLLRPLYRGLLFELF